MNSMTVAEDGGSERLTDRREVRMGLIVALIALLALVIGLSVGLSQNASRSDDKPPQHEFVPGPWRINCIPESHLTVTRELCESRGCVHDPISDDSESPACYMSPSQGSRYRMDSLPEATPFGLTYTLKARGKAPFDEAIPTVKLELQKAGNNVLRLKLTDAAQDRYEVPWPLNLDSHAGDQPQYEFKVTGHDPFSFQVLRNATGTVIFDTGHGGLVLSDRFLQIATQLPSRNVYGLGENVHSQLRHDLNHRTWPLFSRDEWPGQEAESNLYGVHPFYECVEKDGNSHGVLLYNSNAMDYEFTPAPMLVFRTIGGVIDLYFFMGPTPENVIQQYTGAVGRPYMPPYWALGFQQSRYGYSNTSQLKAAVNRTVSNDIPLDVVHWDIDYMHGQRDFTVDPIHYADMPEYVSQLKEMGIRSIVIIDPCIEVNNTYEPFTRGHDLDVYIKWESPDNMAQSDFEETNSTAMLGYVWPNWKVVFPDFLLNSTEPYWEEQLIKFRDSNQSSDAVAYEGLWLDMNEPANFGTNEEKPWNWPDSRVEKWSLKCPEDNYWDDPPYQTKAAFMRGKRLSDKTLCLQGVQGEAGRYRHYDVHSLFGHSQTKASLGPMRAALGDDKRGLILTRSTFVGSGHWGGHWLGDNSANWQQLRDSIIGMLEFNLFGIPYVGADICGYFGDTTVELCKRWMQLGAFYPFSRNHNGKDNIDQDPGSLGDDVIVASQRSLRLRYKLLPYLYTLFHKAHTNGDTVVRPLFHEYPEDSQALTIHHQFLWGPALLISPILQPGIAQLRYYLPSGTWYDFWETGQELSGPGYQTIAVNRSTDIGVHMRGGHIMPLQNVPDVGPIHTDACRKEPFSFIVAPDDSGEAHGTLFWDDGESIDTYEKGIYFMANFSHSNNITSYSVMHDEGNSMTSHVMSVILLGILAEPLRVEVNGEAWNSTYDEQMHTATVSNMSLAMTENFQITWY